MIFKTNRLIVRTLKQSDADSFYLMMSNPNVMNPIPQKVFTRVESDAKLSDLIAQESSSTKKLWAITEKENDTLIGICGLIKNDENDDEIVYRLSEVYWGIGYGTEIAKGLIHYAFEILKLYLLTADVNVENVKSAKILDKFMTPVREFFNEGDNCVDRRYVLRKGDWLQEE